MSNYLRIKKVEHYVGERVRIRGIVENIKNQGGLIFVEVNDLLNSVEALIIPDMKDAHAVGQKLKKGFLVEVGGIVKECPVSAQESDQKQKIEIETDELAIISARSKMVNVIKISEGSIPDSLDESGKII